MAKKTLFVIIIAVVLLIAAVAIFSFYSPDTVSFGNKIAIIKVQGAITSSESILLGSTANPNSMIKLLDKANDDPSIKAIVLEINSPGGAPVASDEIASKVKSLNKTTVAWISDTGTSGAYWVASSADKIVAHPLSITCSIGAFTVVSDFTEFFEKYGFNFTTIKSGELKDVGSPYKPLTEKEKEILQDMIDQVQESFINEVKENRNLNDRQISEIEDARPCLGKQALDYGLVDKLGNKQDAIVLAAELAEIKKPKIITLKAEKELFSNLFSSSLNKAFYLIGVGIGHGLQDEKENNLFIES